MVIADEPGFVFVHIPKTAGTSLTTALEPEGSRLHPLCLRNTKHETLQAFVDRVGAGALERRTCFAVVRDPLDRFVSHFRYLKTVDMPEIRPLATLDDYAQAVELGVTEVCKPARVSPQHRFISLGGELATHALLRYETLAGDFSQFCERLGMPGRDLPTLNRSSVPVASVSDRVKRFVADYYAEDYALFGYEPRI